MTDTDSTLDTRHKARMERKKAVVDAAIAAATDKRGVLLVNTGNGKGKSSAWVTAFRPAWCSSSRAAPTPAKKPSSAASPA